MREDKTYWLQHPNIVDICQLHFWLSLSPFVKSAPDGVYDKRDCEKRIQKDLFIYLFGVLRRFQHCTGHITTGSWTLNIPNFCFLNTKCKKIKTLPYLDLRSPYLSIVVEYNLWWGYVDCNGLCGETPTAHCKMRSGRGQMPTGWHGFEPGQCLAGKTSSSGRSLQKWRRCTLVDGQDYNM